MTRDKNARNKMSVTAKKNKKKYYQSSKQNKKGVLEPGLKGFLITTNNEKQCVKEAYNLLNEFADDIFGPENKDASQSEKRDIEDELQKEIETINTKKRRFQQVFTTIKGILFINSTVPNPTQLTTAIFQSILQSAKRKSRYIAKIIPIEITCKTSHAEIQKHVDKYLEDFLKEDKNKKLNYKVETKIRHNSNITTSHVLSYIRESVEKHAPDWSASLIEPELFISVYVIKSVCCIGFLKNYFQFKKYNLTEFAASVEKTQDTAEAVESKMKEKTGEEIEFEMEDKIDEVVEPKMEDEVVEPKMEDEVVESKMEDGTTDEVVESKMDDRTNDEATEPKMDHKTDEVLESKIKDKADESKMEDNTNNEAIESKMEDKTIN